MTKVAPHALLLTGASLGLGSGCFNATAHAPNESYFAARRAGGSLLSGLDSLMRPSPDTQPSRVKPSQSLRPSNTVATSSGLYRSLHRSRPQAPGPNLWRSRPGNARLRNLKEKTLPYSFKMVYIPGVRNCTSDALSRHPSSPHNPPEMSLPDAVSAPPPRIPLSLMAGLSVETDATTDEMDESDLVFSMSPGCPAPQGTNHYG